MSFQIRLGDTRDLTALETLYSSAFPDEDLAPLVQSLIVLSPRPLSLVATQDAEIIGHVMFTEGRVASAVERLALLGPLAVAPHAQRRGVGSALVRQGLERLTADGAERVVVLGDPAYYGRFGFETETRIATPFPIPESWTTAWRSRSLQASGASDPPEGVFELPTPWMRPELWSP